MDYLKDIVAGTVLVIGAVLVIISRIPKQTIEEQSKLIETQKEFNITLAARIEQLEVAREEDAKNHIGNIKAIADLQGQIKVYKELPLNDIALAMKDIAVSNALILTTLQRSAVINAEDREFLTSRDNQTVNKQTVIHQDVKNKD